MDDRTAIDILKSIKPTLMGLECRTGKGVADALGVGIRAIEKQMSTGVKVSDSGKCTCPTCGGDVFTYYSDHEENYLLSFFLYSLWTKIRF